MNDLEPLLIASVKIARLEKEARLSLDAMEALRETLQVRENTIALLEARLRVSDIKLQRRTVSWPINDLGANV